MCQRLWENSVWFNESRNLKKNPIKLSRAPEREDVKPRLVFHLDFTSFSLSLPFPVPLLPCSSERKGNYFGWASTVVRTDWLRPVARGCVCVRDWAGIERSKMERNIISSISLTSNSTAASLYIAVSFMKMLPYVCECMHWSAWPHMCTLQWMLGNVLSLAGDVGTVHRWLPVKLSLNCGPHLSSQG